GSPSPGTRWAELPGTAPTGRRGSWSRSICPPWSPWPRRSATSWSASRPRSTPWSRVRRAWPLSSWRSTSSATFTEELQKGLLPLPSVGLAPIRIVTSLLTEREYELVREVIVSCQLAEVSDVYRFEEALAAAQGAPYVVATSNGTTALDTALLAVGVRPGDKVLTTPFTFIATANAILFCGARPVFADVSMETANLDPASVEAALKADPSIRYMLVVHLYGLPAPMRELMALA